MVDSQASAAALSPPKDSITTLIKEGVMLKSAPRKVVYKSDTKQTVRMSQEENAQFVLSSNLADFGKRLREAFNNASNVEIAKVLGVTEAGVRNYLNGRIPSAETLYLISVKTNRSIDWLVTGREFQGQSRSVESPEVIEGKPIDKLTAKIKALSDECEKLRPKDKDIILHHIEILYRQVDEYIERYKVRSLIAAPRSNNQTDISNLIDRVKADHPDIKAATIYKVVSGIDLEDIDSSTISIIREYAGIPENGEDHNSEVVKNRS
jgi:transcriptional regulator with XRE-family HTH domain